MTCDRCVLDAQQIEAVVACEDAQLVLASAGSGKTLSLLAKIEYINHVLKVPATQILVISFTQKTVQELKQRCTVKDVEISTFHSLGNHILQIANYQNMTQKRLISDTAIAQFIKTFCEYMIDNDDIFARHVIDFILFFKSMPRSPDSPHSFAEKINFNRLYLRNTLKSSTDKSIFHKDEQLIANWLYLYNLDFSHNIPYPHIKSKYRPTFTIKIPSTVYIDHICINRKGKSIYGSNYLRDIA